MSYNDLKSKRECAPIYDGKSTNHRCDHCGVPVSNTKDVTTRQAEGEIIEHGSRTKSSELLCTHCWTRACSTQYMPHHPKANADGFVRALDLHPTLGGTHSAIAPQRPPRLRKHRLPYDPTARHEREHHAGDPVIDRATREHALDPWE